MDCGLVTVIHTVWGTCYGEQEKVGMKGEGVGEQVKTCTQ
jgi:hypothetical protein